MPVAQWHLREGIIGVETEIRRKQRPEVDGRCSSKGHDVDNKLVNQNL